MLKSYKDVLNMENSIEKIEELFGFYFRIDDPKTDSLIEAGRVFEARNRIVMEMYSVVLDIEMNKAKKKRAVIPKPNEGETVTKGG